MRALPSRLRWTDFAWTAALGLLLCPLEADAACNPASCDAEFDCGSRLCDGPACATFFEDAGTECRSAAGVCDRAESCNGHSLACPSDAKKSAATVCRESSSPCDASEHCDGASIDCPADSGAAPAIASVAIVASTQITGGIVLGHDVFIEVTGTNLCSVGFATHVIETGLQRDGDLPATRMTLDRSYATPEELAADFPPGECLFSVNDGAVEGTVPFTPGAPDGSLEILAPPTDSVLDGDPTFTISNHCTNCDSMRLSFENDGLAEFLVSRVFSPLPIDQPTEISYSDMIVVGSGVLGEGHYEFHAESIDGSFVADQTFAGDPGGDTFTYLSGTSLRDETEFTVPEPAQSQSTLAAVAALAACLRARVRRIGHGASF